MANTAQARKRVRQAVKSRDRNVAQKSNFRTCIKKVLKSLADKNKAARHKSRLNAHIKALA